MPVLRVQVVVDTSALDALKQALADSPRRFYTEVNNTILPQAQRKLDTLLNKPGAPTGGHYRFSTLKSQRYYFATHKPPYQRTGAVQSWRVILTAFSGRSVELLFENPVPYAKYVYGDASGGSQAIGHRGRWVNAGTVLPGLVETVLNDLSTAWVELLDAQGKAA